MRVIIFLFLFLIRNTLFSQDGTEFNTALEGSTIIHVFEKNNKDLILTVNVQDEANYGNPDPAQVVKLKLMDKDFNLKKELLIKDSLKYAQFFHTRKVGDRDLYLTYGYAVDSFNAISQTKILFYFIDGELNVVKKITFNIGRNGWFSAPAYNDELRSKSILTFHHISTTFMGKVKDIRFEIDPLKMEITQVDTDSNLNANSYFLSGNYFRSPYDSKNYFLGTVLRDENEKIIDQYFQRTVQSHHARDRVQILGNKLFIGGPLGGKVNTKNGGGIFIYDKDFFITKSVLTSTVFANHPGFSNYFESDKKSFLYLCDVDFRPNPLNSGYYYKESHILKVDTNLNKIYEFVLGKSNDAKYFVEGITPLANGDLLVYGYGNELFYDYRLFPFIVRLSSDGKIKKLVGIKKMEDNFQLTTYPNPTSDLLRIESSNLDGKLVTIFNLIGSKVYHSEINGDYIEISTQNFQSGTYVYQIQNKDNIILSTGEFIRN
jgi:hypothetical protein